MKLYEAGGTLQMLRGIYTVVVPLIFSTEDKLFSYYGYKRYLSHCFDGVGNDNDVWREEFEKVIWSDHTAAIMFDTLIRDVRAGLQG
jgi:hypothetical protein